VANKTSHGIAQYRPDRRIERSQRPRKPDQTSQPGQKNLTPQVNHGKASKR
jgi:hypothetical protein